MASKVTLMNAVFTQFNLFLTELSEMYPDDPDFPLFLNSIKLLKSTNPSLVIKYIYDNTEKFEQQILNKDEKFFIEYSFSEFSNDVDLDVFSKLKNYSANMSASTKENVWKYIQNIYRLSKAISNGS